MKQLSRHIARHVTSAVLLVLAVLMGLFAVTELADELSGSGEQLNLGLLLHYVLLKLPGTAVRNTGVAMLIGCLMGLGVLASQSELVVMRASGVSAQRIVWMVLRPMLLLMLAASLAGEYIVPALERQAAQLLAEERNADSGQPSLTGHAGLWLRQGNDFLHLAHVQPDGTVFGFARLAFDDSGSLQLAQYAARATHRDNGSQRGWQLEHVRITHFSDSSTNTAAGSGEDFWASELEPTLLSAVSTDPASMSLRELHYYSSYLSQQRQDAREFALVFWQKALQPLAMIGLVLVAISFIFGPLRDTTMGYRLFTGVMVGIVFRFSQDLLGPTSLVYGLSPVIAVAAPIAVCWLLGLMLLARTR